MINDQRLARRIEAARADSAITFARAKLRVEPASRAKVESFSGGRLVFAGDDAPGTINRAVGFGFDGPVQADFIDRIERFYGAPGQIIVSPLADESVVRSAVAAGYGIERFDSVLYRDFTAAPIEASLPVQRVDESGSGEWAVTLRRGFGDAAPDPARALNTDRPLFADPAFICVLARLDGEPAGAAGMHVGDDVAFLFAASTVPSSRRRGVHEAMLQARLTLAREGGATLAAVITEPGSQSQRNLERLGFRVAYTSLTLARAS